MPKTDSLRPATAKIVSVIAVGGREERELLALAASLAPGLARVLADVFAGVVTDRQTTFDDSDAWHDSGPVGVAATLNGHSVVVGNAALLNQFDISVERLGDAPERLRRRGEHVMFVSIDGRIGGVFGILHGRD
jgi:Cu+-exporting ATPase